MLIYCLIINTWQFARDDLALGENFGVMFNILEALACVAEGSFERNFHLLYWRRPIYGICF